LKLSKRQLAAIHQAAQAAGLDDAAYREALLKQAGVRSAKDPHLTREGFIRVMTHFEALCSGRLPGFTPGYWFGQDMRGDPRDSLLAAVRREAAALGFSDEELDRFLASEHMSNGRYQSLKDAPKEWLSKLLDGLKAVRRRRTAKTKAPSP
jgi:hypothetical protein